MAQIRALAVHVPLDMLSMPMLDRIAEVVNRVHRCLREFRVAPWSLRLVYPAVSSVENLDKYLGDLNSVIGNNMLIGIGVEGEGSKARLDKIVVLLHKYTNLYSSVRCDTDYCLERASGHIYTGLSGNTDVNIYTRFALLIGSWVETPYFPATSNVSNSLGISISLRYVDLIAKALIEGDAQGLYSFIEDVNARISDVARCCGMPFLGLDLSISPWMSESVADLIEKLTKNRIGFPGTINAIYGLNRLIDGLARKLGVRSIGFNEVMLSVAEDAILNERVKDGDIRLRDLVNYSTVCAVGLDMAVIPRNLDIQRLAMDMLTVYKVKRRSVALRVIPVDQEPGSAIELAEFGKVFVIRP